MDVVEKLYWFGFLCVDGWLIEKTQRLGFELAKKDRDRLEEFVKLIELPQNRIKERKRYPWDKLDNFSPHNMCYVIFKCKPMINKLLEYGFRESTSKTNPKLKQLPPIITSLISQAKTEALEGRFISENIYFLKISEFKQWYYTKSGNLDLTWLIGFYDGDGHHMEGRSASIASSSVFFLKQIEQAFMSRNRVREYKFPSLSLGPGLFNAMMCSFGNSMARKRFELYEK